MADAVHELTEFLRACNAVPYLHDDECGPHPRPDCERHCGERARLRAGIASLTAENATLRARLEAAERERDEAQFYGRSYRERWEQDRATNNALRIDKGVLTKERDTARAEVEVRTAELAALSEAAMDADLWCWGATFDREKSKHYAHRLRLLCQPNRDRTNAAWVLLDRLHKAEAEADSWRKRAEAAEAQLRPLTAPATAPKPTPGDEPTTPAPGSSDPSRTR